MPLQEDFDRIAASEKIDFVPEFVHSLHANMRKLDDGTPLMLIDINDVKCLLTPGVPNRVEKPFFDAYCNAYELAYGTSPENPVETSVENIARDGAHTWEIEVNQSEDENDNVRTNS